MSKKKKLDSDVKDAPEKTEKKKAKRSDVATRKEANKTTKFTVVKTSFNVFCTDFAKTLNWDSVLTDLNKTVFEAYILANVHAIRLCEAGKSLQKFDQVMCYRFLSAVSEAPTKSEHIKDVDLLESISIYRSWRSSPPASSEHLSAGWQNNISQQMATNIKNSVKANFYRKLLKYVKSKHGISGKVGYTLLKNVLDSDYSGNDPLVLEYRDLIPRPRGGVESHPELALPILYEIYKYFETLPEAQWPINRNGDRVEP
ncbi:hypothetical protein HDU93_006182, partial [Gonapodya sp. JEL0774]